MLVFLIIVIYFLFVYMLIVTSRMIFLNFIAVAGNWGNQAFAKMTGVSSIAFAFPEKEFKI
jgi:hypothetical protein